MNLILKYSNTDIEPTSGENVLVMSCVFDDRIIEPIQEDTILADKTIFPDRQGRRKKLTVYLNPDQVEDNLDFLKNMLGAQNVWASGGRFVDGANSILCSIEDREYLLKFLELVNSPITFKSCKVFPSVLINANGETDVASLSEADCSGLDHIYSNAAVGQSFKGNGDALKSCEFWMQSEGTMSAQDCYAELYASNGTYGVDNVPSGGALAVSEDVGVLSIGATFRWVKFLFAGGYILEAGVPYVILVTFPGGSWASCLNVGLVQPPTVIPDGVGNICTAPGSREWTALNNSAACFKIHGIKDIQQPGPINTFLKYSIDDTEPGDDGYLELSCVFDDRGISPVQEETEIANKTLYPERDGHHKTVSIFLDPDQVEDNLEFIQNMLGAKYIWCKVGDFNDDGDALLCSIEDREYDLKFHSLIESPLTFKSCKVFSE